MAPTRSPRPRARNLLYSNKDPVSEGAYKEIEGLKVRKFLSGIVCTGLLLLLLRVDLTTNWISPGPKAIGELATERIGEHLFTDYLLPFEVASVLLLMAMIGAIVLTYRKKDGVKRQDYFK